MTQKDKDQKTIAALRKKSPYNASITREQFLFYEMRTTAQLLCDGLSDKDVVERIVSENLFQYPTEKSIRKMALACIRRLHLLNDTSLISAVATQPSEISKQVCLYAMMKQFRLIWDFMITVIGEKYRLRDTSFSRMDINVFFIRLQEQDDGIATCSESTISRIKQILIKILVENDYLDKANAEYLNPVWLSPILENAIRANNDDKALSAFNNFS